MSSILSHLFSSRVIRGQYSDEKPMVDIALEGSKREKKRLTAMINRIARSSSKGKEALEAAAKGGYTLSMQMQEGAMGFCDREKKIMALSPNYSDRKLIATLAHEARHAQQFERGADEDFSKRNIKSSLMYFRAMEADAQAIAAATCLEMAAAGDKTPWEMFARKEPEIASRLDFCKADQSFEVTPKVMREAFLGWYDNSLTKQGYEDAYIHDPMSIAISKEKEGELPYAKEEKSADVVALFCQGSDGKCYFSNNPDILETPSMLDITETSVNKIDYFFKMREERTGIAPDMSYKSLQKREEYKDLFGVRITSENYGEFDRLFSKSKPVSVKKPVRNPQDLGNKIPNAVLMQKLGKRR